MVQWMVRRAKKPLPLNKMKYLENNAHVGHELSLSEALTFVIWIYLMSGSVCWRWFIEQNVDGMKWMQYTGISTLPVTNDVHHSETFALLILICLVAKEKWKEIIPLSLER